jgi:molybdopterin converting factor small subunit
MAMNKVKVIFLGALLSATKDREVDVPVGDQETVRTLLSRLNERFGQALQGILFDSTGELRRNVIVQHKGENIVTKKGLDTEIQSDDLIVIMQAVAGG